MARLRRPELLAEARRRTFEQLTKLGAELRASRRRRRSTQRQLAAAIGVVQSTISEMERGFGGSLSVDVWQRAFLALDRPLVIGAARDPLEATEDVGHVLIQELILRLARAIGITRTFELGVRPATSRHSIDVFLRDDRRRRLSVIECTNVSRDIGSEARSFTWKLTRSEEIAVVIGGERPYAVGGCIVLRATRRNRSLVATYPEVFASRYPGSSAGWVRALMTGAEPPSTPGLVWCDVKATRLFAWRRRR